MRTLWFILISLALGCAAFFIGRCTAPLPEPVIEYIELPPIVVERDSSQIRPVSERLSDPIRFASIPSAATDSSQPDAPDEPVEPLVQPLDTLAAMVATVEDWNIERKYHEIPLDNDTVGRVEFDATVQYNKLTHYRLDITPVQRSEVVVESAGRRVGGYALGVATNRSAMAGAGVRFGKVGIHGVVGYDYPATTVVYGGGFMVAF